MDKLFITPIISESSRKELSDMADTVWESHYKALSKASDGEISILALYNRGSTLLKIIKSGLYYFITNTSKTRIGYFALTESGDGAVLIYAIYLIPEERGKRYGRRILRLIEKFSRNKGVHSLSAVVPIIDQKAIRFFKANNYNFNSKHFNSDSLGNQVEYDCMLKVMDLEEAKRRIGING